MGDNLMWRRIVASLVAVAAAALATPAGEAIAAAPADTSPSRVSGVRFASKNYIFARSATANQIVFRDISSAGTWKTIPGTTPVSAPSAILMKVPGDQVWVFATGANGNVYVTKSSDLVAWTAWSSLGGTFTGAPAAVSGRPNNSAFIAARVASTGTYQYRYLVGSTWSAWRAVGGEAYTTSPGLSIDHFIGEPGDNYWAVWVNGRRSDGSVLRSLFYRVPPGTPGGWLFPDRESTQTSTPGGGTKSPVVTDDAGGTDGIWEYWRTNDDRLRAGTVYAPGTANVVSVPGVITSGTNNWVCAKTPSAAVSCITFNQVSGAYIWGTWASVGGNVL